MSKEEFLKIKTCVLKVNIHCDGCKHKVKKILQKIEGVYTTKIDSEQGKVTVSGIVEPASLIKKLAKNGKHAELWGAPKAANNPNNQNQLNNQLKNMQIDHGKGGSKGQGQKGVNNQPKGGQQGQNNQQQLQKLKGFADLKLPQFKDLKMPFNNNNKAQNQKAVKFNLPDDDDDEFDDDDEEFDYDEEFDDDEFDDEIDDTPLNKMKPVMNNGHGGAQMPNMMLNGMMMNGQHPQLMQGGNGKKGGGGGNIPVQVNMGGGGGNNAKKGGGNGNNNGGNQNQGGGKNGGGQPSDGKNGGGGGGQNKNGNNGGAAAAAAAGNGNGGKKGGGKIDGFHGMMPNMMAVNGGAKVGQMGNVPMPMGQMGQMGNVPMGQMGNVPMGQMGNIPAVQGLPAPAINGGGAGYYQGAGPEMMPGNPYYQQQLAAAMMNQQRANGNERFQPMMYARPPPAVNYMPPPYPYPYPPPQDHYSSIFSDENTSSCSIM